MGKRNANTVGVEREEVGGGTCGRDNLSAIKEEQR